MTQQTRRSFLASAAAAPLFAQRKGEPARRPNICLILADDLPAWLLGCYGNLEVKTPHMDRLAAAGTRFLNSFVCTPICSPSRATLFTGRTPRQHGIEDFLTANPATDPPQGQTAPPPSFQSETMLFDLLSKAGYRCGYAGKWHMGGDANPGHGISFSYTMTEGQRSYRDPEMSLNGQTRREKGYLTELVTQRALEFLDSQPKDSPFFLTLGYLNPHTPYEGHPEKYYDMYAGVNFATFGIQPKAPSALREARYMDDPIPHLRRAAASVTALDDQLPVLQRKLLEKGLFDNTIVILTGDNGYLHGRHGLWSKGHASNPINMYEEVMQVPMIWSWPGRVPTQSARPELISFYDFFPTVCEAAGVEPPAGRNLVGRSYLPLVTNQALPKERRWRDLVFGHPRHTELARDNRYKLILRNSGAGPNELYDLRQDPREKVNQFDNPAYITIRQSLDRELQAWRARQSA